MSLCLDSTRAMWRTNRTRHRGVFIHFSSDRSGARRPVFTIVEISASLAERPSNRHRPGEDPESTSALSSIDLACIPHSHIFSARSVPSRFSSRQVFHRVVSPLSWTFERCRNHICTSLSSRDWARKIATNRSYLFARKSHVYTATPSRPTVTRAPAR